MRNIPVSEKYHGIKSVSIIYHGLAKYRGISSGGTDVQYAFIIKLLSNITSANLWQRYYIH